MSETPATKRSAVCMQQRQNKQLYAPPHVSGFIPGKATTTSPLTITIVVMLFSLVASCASITQRQSVRPLVLRDVPAQRLAYRFEADVALPPEAGTEGADDKIEAIQLDFNTRRQDDAIVRTVRSPDGQRALVLYGKGDEPSQEFHIDLYSSDGRFLRNLTPPDLACVFSETVSWSPDGNFITFIGHKGVKPTPTPPPEGATPPEPAIDETESASPLPSMAPAFPSVPLFTTEQIYICNRDGEDLKPLTAREGLIYFQASWAPDNHALVAMACREAEWSAREREFKLATGRPRLITLDGKERLLDDELTEALPVWSPDASKVATAFDTEVMIYDAATEKPTQARIRLREPLLAASRLYEAKNSARQNEDGNGNNGESSAGQAALPPSFNPIIRLQWLSPERLYLQTAYERVFPNDPISTFQRWHLVLLSPQAAALK